MRCHLTTCAAKDSLECDLDALILNVESVVLASSLDGVVTQGCGIERLQLEGGTSQQTDTCGDAV